MKRMRRNSTIALALTLLAAAGLGGAAEDDVKTFDEALALAHAYDRSQPPGDVEKDIELAIRFYRRALELRPDDPGNMMLEFAIGGELLDMDDQPERVHEGLAIFEGILDRYTYLDYYEKYPDYGSNSPQYKMVTVAIYAAGFQNDKETARDTYFRGLKMLDSTYRRRLEDWRNEPSPPKPDFNSPFEGGELELSKWKSRLAMWETRQQAVARGEIFPPDGLERVLIPPLVRDYAGTYNGGEGVSMEEILAPVLEAFPGTPIEEEALRFIRDAEVQKEAH